jgi:hypothetical protein
MALKKVQPGDPLAIPAMTFNTFIDAARDFQRRQRSVSRAHQRESRQAGVVLIRNESGGARNRFDVLGINGPIITPNGNAAEFESRVAIRGAVPSTTHFGRFGVLLEPLASNAIGRACIDGICVARVRMVGEDHEYADISHGDPSRLESGSSGSAQLLWVEPEEDRADPEVARCIVRIGAGGTADKRVIVRQVGGAAGDAETQCSFRYNGWIPGSDPDTDDPLFTDKQPLAGRTEKGQYVEQPDGATWYGTAIWNADTEEWDLWTVPHEVPAIDPCQPCEPGSGGLAGLISGGGQALRQLAEAVKGLISRNA